jgi:tetratricopeptide (TPR) repeat protein
MSIGRWTSTSQKETAQMESEGNGHPDFAEQRLLVDSVPEAESATLRHLLGCPRCLTRLLSLALGGDSDDFEGVLLAEDVEDLEDEPLGPAEAMGVTAARPVAKVWNRSAEIELRRARDRRLAPALYDELLAASEDGRRVLIGSDARYASPGLAELLLEAAGETARNAPSRATCLARLALNVAERVDCKWYGNDVGGALAVAGWSRVAEALQLAEDYSAAGEALRLAGQAVEAVAIDSLERALYCRVAALVRYGEGRIDEALGLLLRAAEIYRQRDDHQALGEVLAEKGWILATNDALAAVEPLRAALNLVESTGRPWTALRIYQALALCYAELDKRGEATELLARGQGLRDEVCDPIDRLQCAWTDALIADRLSKPAEAVEILRTVIAGFARYDRPFDAALAAVDVVEICVLADREVDLETLRRREAELVAPLPEAPGVALTMTLRLAGTKGLRAPFMLARVREYLRRARQQPQRRYQPSRQSVTTIAWDDLAVDARRKVCELLGVDQVIAEQRAGDVEPRLRDLIGWSFEELKQTRIVWTPAADVAA